MTTEGFLRSGFAADPRTLLDVLRATVDAHAESPALDDGSVSLTYRELWDAVQAARGRARGGRHRARRPRRRADPVGHRRALHGDPRRPGGRRRVRAGRRGRPGRARSDGLRRGRRRAGADRGRPGGPHQEVRARRGRRASPTTPGSSSRPAPPARPKGVAVTHRSAAAFVDAEARMFLQDAPLGPGDRVLAGLSVAFDASCEEMWLAWGHGACLVPAPRALVRTGMDLGPWLVAQGITVISTVPTLAGLWRSEVLAGVRLLIFGGEACPPELAARLVGDGREVWNTYGPTEATVVACGALLTGEGPVRIGHALDGWDLAVVGPDGVHVAEGEVGELIIGGVGLARYLDAAKDAEKYARRRDARLGARVPQRRPGPVRGRGAAVPGPRRRPGQGRRPTDRAGRGRRRAARAARASPSAAAAVRRTPAGTAVLVGYLVPDPGVEIDLAAVPRGPARHPARGPRPAARARGADPDARLRQGRPRRAAVAARAPRRRRPARGRPLGDRPVGRAALDRRARGRRGRTEGRLLRRGRRQPRRRAARLGAARAVPDRHRRGRLREPADRRPRPDARRVRAGERRGRAGRAARPRCGPR